jgi:hypothetical protein
MEKFMDDFIQDYGDLSARSYVTPTLEDFCEIDKESELWIVVDACNGQSTIPVSVHPRNPT